MTVHNLADLLDAADEVWQDRALCAQVEAGDVFFPERGESPRAAKQICALCEVREDCLDYALKHDIHFGVYGGLTDLERRVAQKVSTYTATGDIAMRDRYIHTLARKDCTPKWIAARLGMDRVEVETILGDQSFSTTQAA